MLTDTKMYYAEFQQNPDDEDDSEDRPLHPKDNSQPLVISKELHFAENWFHGRLEGGRSQAAHLLKKYSDLGDGTFLVRESDTFVGDYSLSFLRHGQVNHCRIRSKLENGVTKYHLIDTVTFDSIYSLITYYQSHSLQSQDFSIRLTHPVPQMNSHEQEDWYHPQINRLEAESLVKSVDKDGGFLVRPSENDQDCYSITFQAGSLIKHCRIRQEGRLYVIGSVKHENLKALINWYQKNSLYKDVKLKYPISKKESKGLIRVKLTL